MLKSQLSSKLQFETDKNRNSGSGGLIIYESLLFDEIGIYAAEGSEGGEQ